MATITLKNIAADLDRELKKGAESFRRQFSHRQRSALRLNIGD